MKKLFNKILIILVIFATAISCSSLFNKNVSAEKGVSYTELPNYYSVTTATVTKDETGAEPTYSYTEILSSVKYKNGQAIIVDGSSTAIKLDFLKKITVDGQTIDCNVYHVQPVITINDVQLGSDHINRGIVISEGDENVSYQIILDPSRATSHFSYGKYEINYTYVLNGELASLSHTFYVYNSSSFEIKFENANEGGTANVHYYNYQTSNVINMKTNQKFFNITITKTFKQLAYTTTFNYSSAGLVVTNLDNNNVKTTEQYVNYSVDENDILTIYFENLGVYYINYEVINPHNKFEITDDFYLPSGTLNPALSHTVHVYGSQNLYSTNLGTKDFKVTENGSFKGSYTLTTSGSTSTVTTATPKSSDITYLKVLDENLNLNNITPVSTNQAPLIFTYNTTITDAKYVYSTEKFTENPTSLNDYDLKSLSEPGYYYIELAYSYEGVSIASPQYFYFQITNTAPTFEMNEYTYNSSSQEYEIGNTVYSYDYTNKDVLITKEVDENIFNATSKLSIYKDSSYKGTSYSLVSNDEKFVATENGLYKVEVSYGNFNHKNYISYFYLDKSEIQNINVKNAINYSGSLYEHGKVLNNDNLIITNQSVAIDWSEKASGAKTYAEFKYFATSYNVDLANYLTSSNLQLYYNNPNCEFSIPSTHTINYNGGELPKDSYANTYGVSILKENNILSNSGLYIIRVFDQMDTELEGNFYFIFIDKTPTNLINVIKDNWSINANAIMSTEDVDVYFGQNKLIRFDGLNNSNKDTWLNNYIYSNTEIMKNFTSFNIDSQYYLKIGINNNIQYLKDSDVQTPYVLNADNDYGISLKAYDEQTGKYNESQYMFYSVTDNHVNYSNNYHYYRQNYNTTYTVNFTTDNSKMTVSYYNQDGTTQFLTQLPVNSIFEGNVLVNKQNYYQPTAEKTLQYSEEILNFKYTVVNDKIKVKNIILKYYPFVKSDTNETYIFDENNVTEKIIYEIDSINVGSLVLSENNTYTWNLFEEIYNQSKTRTRSGKYIITRTYTDDTTLIESDPKTRELTFIVDRNGIISSPEVDLSGNTKYYTGGSIFLKVLNDLYYKDIYFAKQINEIYTIIPILETNLLPVTLYIPQYKYGYTSSDNDNNLIFNKEDSIVTYLNSGREDSKQYSNYELLVSVYKYPTNQKTSSTKTTILENYNNVNNKTNFLDIAPITDVGYYEVVLSTVAGDEFTFAFNIIAKQPEFKITNLKDTKLNQDSKNNYYTNEESVRISWQEDLSPYIGKINKDAITYSFAGNSGTLNKNEIKYISSTNTYYIDLNLKNIGAYVDNTNVSITLQYLGNQNDYAIGTFSKTSNVIVDLTAPNSNITNLISLSGFNVSQLRDFTDSKFNVSVNSGLLAYYSYVVDVNNFKSIIKAPEDVNYDYSTIYFKVFNNNEKYSMSSIQESNITVSNFGDNYNFANTLNSADKNAFFNALLSESNKNKYIELVEEDFAGNRTVYCIYLTDLQLNSESENAYYKLRDFEYEKISSNMMSQTPKPEKINPYLSENVSVDLYSKLSFNLSNISNLINFGTESYYSVVTVNNLIYVKSPYSNNLYYKLNNFESFETSEGLTLKQITTLKPNSNVQNIKINNIPYFGSINLNVYVVNKVISVYTLSQITSNPKDEGILIEYPSTVEANKLYINKLEIFSYIKNHANGTYSKSNNLLSSLNISEVLLDTELKQTNYGIFELSNLTYKGKKYLQIKFTNTYMQANYSTEDYFIYNYEDNYGDKFSIAHICGYTDILNPISSKNGVIVESYNNLGQIVNYCTENITFTYNSTMYSSLKITNGLNIFTITNNTVKDASGKTLDDTAYSQYFTFTYRLGNIIVEFKASEYNFKNNQTGDMLSYNLELEPNSNFNIDSKTYNICLYNKIPNITLLNKDGVNITHILGNNEVYTGNVYVNYNKIKLDFEYDTTLVLPDKTVVALNNVYSATESGEYSIVINYYIGEISGLSKTIKFTISDNENFIFMVMKIMPDGTKQEVKSTGKEFTIETGYNNYDIYNIHYIVNGDYEIITNEYYNLKYTKTILSDGYTTAYNIYTDPNAETTTQYISYNIAVTQIPSIDKIFNENEFSYYTSTGENKDLTTSRYLLTSVETKSSYDKGLTISWAKYNIIKENLVNIKVYYNDFNTEYAPKVSEYSDKFTATFKLSGIYYIKFIDIAGNTHMFGEFKDNEYFTLQYLSSAIFKINDQTPINYSFYNESVKINIPKDTLSYYDSNSRPIINVELNGVKLEISSNKDYEWTFDQIGTYKVWFTSKINNVSIYENPIYFTILSSDESRSSFTYSSYADYFIEDILYNGVSVLSKLANANNGTVYNDKYLKNLTIYKYDIKTGQGYWTFKINTNNEFGQKFDFTVWINDPDVPVDVSIGQGESTTDVITVKFNTENMLKEVGECIVKINGFDDFILTKDANLPLIYEKEIKNSGDYTVQVLSLSGELLYSTYFTKTEPLNAVSITLIVVSVILVVGGSIVFFLLRKRMKIR